MHQNPAVKLNLEQVIPAEVKQQLDNYLQERAPVVFHFYLPSMLQVRFFCEVSCLYLFRPFFAWHSKSMFPIGLVVIFWLLHLSQLISY